MVTFVRYSMICTTTIIITLVKHAEHTNNKINLSRSISVTLQSVFVRQTDRSMLIAAIATGVCTGLKLHLNSSVLCQLGQDFHQCAS